MSKSLFNPSEYDRLENCLISEPFVFPAVIDRVHNAAVLCDTGCNIMAAVHSRFVQRNRLLRISIPARETNAYDDKPHERVDHLVHARVDIGGVSSDVWMYEVQRLDVRNHRFNIRY